MAGRHLICDEYRVWRSFSAELLIVWESRPGSQPRRATSGFAWCHWMRHAVGDAGSQLVLAGA